MQGVMRGAIVRESEETHGVILVGQNVDGAWQSVHQGESMGSPAEETASLIFFDRLPFLPFSPFLASLAADFLGCAQENKRLKDSE